MTSTGGKKPKQKPQPCSKLELLASCCVVRKQIRCCNVLYEWYLKWRISLTLCTIGCLAHADHRMIHFLINKSRILPKIELPLKHVSLADSAEHQGKSGILPLCATHIWDSPPSQEIFWLLLAVQLWGRKKKNKFSCSGVLRLQ